MNRRRMLALSGSSGVSLALAHSVVAGATPATSSGNRGSVSVADFGATGNGVDDDTAALQAALDSGARVVYGVPGKVYIINSPLMIPANVTFDVNYATLRGGSYKTGGLDSDGLHISMSNVANAVLRRARIIAPLTACSLNGGNFKAAVVAGGKSTHCLVEDCEIDLAGTGIVEGISFQRADFCTARGNELTGAGIRYSFGGQCNDVLDNVVINEAISGAADPTREAFGCVVRNNRLIHPIVMGIEDYSNPGNNPSSHLRGTRIEGNTIIGGGSPKFFAISAISHSTVVANNLIRNWPHDYAIELMENHGVTCTGNSILWDDGNPNQVRAIQENISIAKIGANVISNNTFTAAATAILIRGDSQTLINGNSFHACHKVLESQDPKSRSIFSNNVIRVTTPAGSTTRTLVGVGSDSVIENNRVSYDSTASGGIGHENTFVVPYDNCIVANNLVDANGIVGGGGAPLAVTSNGMPAANVKILNNIFTGGARASYQFFVNVFAHGNVCASISAPAAAKMAFFDQQTLAAKPAISGSKGANPALASLLTQLAALGILTDNTT